jgi:hypothetical protein
MTQDATQACALCACVCVGGVRQVAAAVCNSVCACAAASLQRCVP